MWTNCRLLGMEGMPLGIKFQPPFCPKYKNLILHLWKYLSCVYTVSVCLWSRLTGRFSLALRGFESEHTWGVILVHHAQGRSIMGMFLKLVHLLSYLQRQKSLHIFEAYISYPRALFLGRNFPGSLQISLALTSGCQSNSSSTCPSTTGSHVWGDSSRSLLHSSHQKQMSLLKPPEAWFPVVFVIEDHTNLYEKL